MTRHTPRESLTFTTTPRARRSPALPNRERPLSRFTPRSTRRTWTSSFAIPTSIPDRDDPGERRKTQRLPGLSGRAADQPFTISRNRQRRDLEPATRMARHATNDLVHGNPDEVLRREPGRDCLRSLCCRDQYPEQACQG